MVMTLRHGVGATCTVLTRFIHPSEHVRQKHKNLDKGHRTLVLLVGVDTKKVRRKLQEVYTFRSDDFNDVDELLYAVKRNVRVLTEGAAEHIFLPKDQPSPSESVTTNRNDDEDETSMPLRTGVLAEEIQTFKAAGVIVDDDNEPAPENVPAPTTSASTGIFKEWGFTGFCYRRSNGHRNVGAHMNRSRDDLETMTRLDYFMSMFPIEHIKTVMLPQMNKKIGPGREPIQFGEYMRWIGIWLVLATTEGHKRSAFWRQDVTCEYAPDHRFEGAPFRLFDVMSARRFNEILEVHTLFARTFPTYTDRFFHVREFIMAWNDNMAEVFEAAWIVCLDESMSLWTNMFTCPGFIFCPRKPWETGNEYHTIACGTTGILFAVEIVEGKDRPKELGTPRFDYIAGKTTGLLLRLTRTIWNTGRVVILDSGFCVLEAIIQLRKKGVFAGALIKKRRYWPKYIKGDAIKKHFEDKDVGSVDAWPGELHGVPFHVFSMKEPDYIMSIMATYGTTNEIEEGETRRQYKGDDGADKSTTFKYTELFYNHYKYRHMVDDNNNCRMQPIAIERTWLTNWWPDRCFAFLLGVSMVNAQKAFEHFGHHKQDEVLQFRRKLAKELIYNPWLPTDDNDGRNRTVKRFKHSSLSTCKLIQIPKNHEFRGVDLIKSNSSYNQKRCKCGTARTRTYCRCTPGIHLCSECYANHRIGAVVA